MSFPLKFVLVLLGLAILADLVATETMLVISGLFLVFAWFAKRRIDRLTSRYEEKIHR